MKIVVAEFYHESNTFNPFSTPLDKFILVEGEKMLDRIASYEVFEKAGAEVIPTIYASALPSGIVEQDAFEYIADKITETLKREEDISGIWLHLHGASYVENIGSGELELLIRIRKIVGDDIPISVTMDIHGNNSPEYIDMVNIVRSYRSVPHIDQSETEQITAELLLKAIKENKQIKPAFVRLPIMIGGEQALGSSHPLKSIFKKLNELEKEEGIDTASFFVSFAWSDTPNTAASIVVVPSSQEYYDKAAGYAQELADYVYSVKEEFDFAALVLSPEDAIQKSIEVDVKPVFISDSGDNTTGGAVGVSTRLLELFLNQNNFNGKKVCITAIYDPKAYEKCAQYDVGDEVELNVGVGYDEDSKEVTLKGILKVKGDLMGYFGCTEDPVGKTCTISIGDLDVVIANGADSFISLNHFKMAGLNIEEYDIISVKQGYLFHELDSIAEMSILALTPGATYQLIEELHYDRVPRPIYPLDRLE